jgi:hypothetical protein
MMNRRAPQGLKARIVSDSSGTAEAVPFPKTNYEPASRLIPR